MILEVNFLKSKRNEYFLVIEKISVKLTPHISRLISKYHKVPTNQLRSITNCKLIENNYKSSF